MANNENLKSLASRPQRERNEIARLGAEASNKKQAEKRRMKDIIQMMLDDKPSEEQIKEIREQFPEINLEDITNRAAMAAALFKNFYDEKSTPLQRVKIFQTIVDCAGERPAEKDITVNTEVDKETQAMIEEYIREALNEDI